MKNSAFLQGVHHAYAQTDGSYAWPNSREGDLLRDGKHEIDRLRKILNSVRNGLHCGYATSEMVLEIEDGLVNAGPNS